MERAPLVRGPFARRRLYSDWESGLLLTGYQVALPVRIPMQIVAR